MQITSYQDLALAVSYLYPVAGKNHSGRSGSGAGTLTNATRTNQGFSFAGSGYLTYPDDSAYSFTGAFTAIICLNPTTFETYAGLIGKGDFEQTVANAGWAISLTSAENLYFHVCDDSANARLRAYTDAATIVAGSWQTFAFIYDGGTSDTSLHIYRLSSAGAVELSVTRQEIGTFSALEDNDQPLYIARSERFSVPQLYTGLIDHVALYGRALTPPELTAHYIANRR